VLRPRLFFGILIIAMLTALCWADAHATRPGVWLVPLAAVLCVLATQEMLVLLRSSGRQPIAWATYVGTLLPVMGACAPIAWIDYPADCPIGKLGWLACGLALGLLTAIVAEMGRYREPGETLANLASTALSILYVGGLLGFLIQLRLFINGQWGLAAMLSVIGTVKLSDTCQYAFGSLLGKHRLAPKLSPGKTWEGTIYGITSTVVIAALVLRQALGRLGTEQTLASLIVYCALVAIAGIAGDLAESMLKRDAGVKDSSSWLPGLGGILDLLDSLLVAAPVAYLCWASGLIGPD